MGRFLRPVRGPLRQAERRQSPAAALQDLRRSFASAWRRVALQGEARIPLFAEGENGFADAAQCRQGPSNGSKAGSCQPPPRALEGPILLCTRRTSSKDDCK